MTSSYTPARVVSLQPSATVILAEIGKLDCLVACTKYCADVCPEVKTRGIAIVSDSWTADSKQITQLHPDLVIAAVPYQEKSVSEILKSGARFFGLAPRTLADIYGDIELIARLMNAAERGMIVISQMKNHIDAMRVKTAGLSRPRVYCEEWGNPLIASQSWVAELVEAAGGEFIGEPGKQTNTEAILRENPDIVIASWCGAGDRVPLEKIVGLRKWENMTAVQHRRVFCISDEFLNTPAPTLINGLRALAFAIHPEIFPHCSGLRSITDVPTFQEEG